MKTVVIVNRKTCLNRAILSGVSAIVLAIMALAGCGAAKGPLLTDLGNGQNLTFFKLDSLRGTRDGDRLDARALFTDTSAMVTLNLHFEITPTARLTVGTWESNRGNRRSSGNVNAKSVDFLGGQSGPPSIGGTYELVNAQGVPEYRVRIPMTELKEGLR